MTKDKKNPIQKLRILQQVPQTIKQKQQEPNEKNYATDTIENGSEQAAQKSAELGYKT